MRDLKLYVFIASALLVIYLMAQYNRPKATDWTYTLDNTSKEPFGTYIAYKQLNDIFPQAPVKTFREPVYNVITDDSVKNGTYIIICEALNFNKYDYEQLVNYIKQGNDVFIAADYFGEELSKKLGVSVAGENNRGNATRIGFLSKDLRDKKYDVDKNGSDAYFSDFDASKAVALGNNEFHHFTYLKFPMGKGNLFLNANPGMFTNYSLLQEMGVNYAAIALSYVHNNKNLWWDEYYTKGRTGGESVMRVFINHYQLRWAFYIATFSLLAFVLYEMKRRQRIIPVIIPLSNSTVDFTTVVGQVYYEQRNNGNIAQKKAAYFLEHIRSEYNMRTNVFDEEFITLLAQKSGAEKELIRQLSQQIIYINMSSRISDSELIDLNKNIEQFYRQSR